MIRLCTFSDESMSHSRNLCAESGLRNGVDRAMRIYADTVNLLPCYRGNEALFRSPRGVGYWAWKPAIIDQMLDDISGIVNNVHDGDTVVYADAGVEFINNVSHVIDRMDQDIFLFGNNWEHAHWCKRDVVEMIWPTPKLTRDDRVARITALEQAGRTDILEIVDDMLSGYASEAQVHNILWSSFGKQCQASVIFFRVSDYTRKFVKEWLDWCLFEGGRLIDDSPSRLPNHPEFQEHRHDQAILTTMAYRDGLKLHYWPAMYNDGAFNYEKLPCYAGDDYPILFHHHRRRNHEWSNAA